MGKRKKQEDQRKIRREAANDTTVRIRQHYKNLGIQQGWNRNRFYRLCRLMHCTEYELGSLCAVFQSGQVDKWLDNDHIPPYVSLHLALLESAWIKAAYNLTKEPIMPLHLLANPKPT